MEATSLLTVGGDDKAVESDESQRSSTTPHKIYISDQQRSHYSYVSNNRVKLIIVLKGNLQLTSMRVVANNRVERIFSLLGQKITHFF